MSKYTLKIDGKSIIGGNHQKGEPKEGDYIEVHEPSPDDNDAGTFYLVEVTKVKTTWVDGEPKRLVSSREIFSCKSDR